MATCAREVSSMLWNASVLIWEVLISVHGLFFPLSGWGTRSLGKWGNSSQTSLWSRSKWCFGGIVRPWSVWGVLVWFRKCFISPFLTLALEVLASCAPNLRLVYNSHGWDIPRLGQIKHKALVRGCAQSRVSEEWLLCLQHTQQELGLTPHRWQGSLASLWHHALHMPPLQHPVTLWHRAHGKWLNSEDHERCLGVSLGMRGLGNLLQKLSLVFEKSCHLVPRG